jgi:uncharacterized membrane protein YuzA (DUF378 family)
VKKVDTLALVLTIVGGLNWSLVGPSWDCDTAVNSGQSR